MYPGRFDEQPMPDTTMQVFGVNPQFAHGFLQGAQGPQSPRSQDTNRDQQGPYRFRAEVQRLLPCSTSLTWFDNVVWLERFPVIFEKLAVDSEARFGTNMAGQLAGVVVFDHQGVAAGLQDGVHFVLMERHQVADLQVVGGNPCARPGRDGLTDDALGGAPANQRHVSVEQGQTVAAVDSL